MFSINKIIKKKQTCLILLVIVLILGICWWQKKNTIIEGNWIDSANDSVRSNLQTVENKVKSSPVVSFITKIHDTIKAAGEEYVAPSAKGAKIYCGDMVAENTAPVIVHPDTSLIINDNCSTRGFTQSDYDDNFCKTYANDNDTINSKCSKLSNNSCKYPKCCVLLNGTKCVAGNANGPLFLTDNGLKVDYDYYLYKNKCYGNCDASDNAMSVCAAYASNSTNVSKACIIQMFNDAGCPYKNPALIDDRFVSYYKTSAKIFIQGEIHTLTNSLINGPDPNKTNHKICYGV